MNRQENLCLAIYRRLASAYPHEFRLICGEDFDRLGEDMVPEAWRRFGFWGLVRLLANTAVHLPFEYLAEFRQDASYAWRTLARSPVFTVVGILSIAIGIGMCSVILSESNGLLRPAPGIEEPSTLLTMQGRVSYPYFEQYQDRHDIVASAAAVLRLVPFAVVPSGGTSPAERVYGQIVSPGYFSTLGVKMAAGRRFDPATEKFGAAPVVVVSERFWRNHLNSNPGVIGHRLRLNGRMAKIIGVASGDFLGVWPWNPSDLFVPAMSDISTAPELSGDPVHQDKAAIFQIVLRLKNGVSIAAAEAALDATKRTLDQQKGLEQKGDRKGLEISLIPAGTFSLITPRQRVFILTTNVILWALVLSLVCANLANLLFAHSSRRRREIAIRLSVGASRARLVRQLLTESILLAAAGGLASIALAFGVTRMISALPLPEAVPVELKVEPDFRVLLFTLAIGVIAGIGFGLFPALGVTRTDPNPALKEGSRGALRRYRRWGVRNLFIVWQVASSLMLLLITGYVVLGYRHTAINPGFSLAGLDLLSIDPVRGGYSADRAAALLANLPDELKNAAGVREIGVTGGVPFANLTADRPNTTISTAEASDDREIACPAFSERIGTGYFAALGAPLLRGREFDKREGHDVAPERAIPAIINQTAARALFGLTDPIGRQMRGGDSKFIVIGMARDVRSGFLMPKPVATIFLPLTAEWFGRNQAQRLTLLVRTAPGREALQSVESELALRHPDLLIFDVKTMQEKLEELNSFIDWSSSIYVVLGILALLLACIGLAGVTAYAVVRRTKEIGVRTALGATTGQVRRMILSEGAVLVIAGSTLGYFGAFTLSRVFSASMEAFATTFAMGANQPALLVGAPVLLSTLAILACYVPAARAARIDPVTALREE